MFVIGGIGHGPVSDHATACFFQGYTGPSSDRRALEYYRYAWAGQDMAAYAEEIVFLPGRSDQRRRDALDGFTTLFAPGNIVAIARSSARSTL